MTHRGFTTLDFVGANGINAMGGADKCRSLAFSVCKLLMILCCLVLGQLLCGYAETAQCVHMHACHDCPVPHAECTATQCAMTRNDPQGIGKALGIKSMSAIHGSFVVARGVLTRQ